MSILIEGKKYIKFTDMIGDKKLYGNYLSADYLVDRGQILSKFKALKNGSIDRDFIRALWVKEKIAGLPSCKQVGFGGAEVYELNKAKLDRIVHIVSTKGNTESCYLQCLGILENLRMHGKIARIPHVFLNRIFIGFYPNEHVDWVSTVDIRKCCKKFLQLADFTFDYQNIENETKWFHFSKNIRAKANGLGLGFDPDYVRFIVSLAFREFKRQELDSNDESLPPESVDEKIWREIVTRRGQRRFRNKLISKYKYCCITNCEDLDALEAAHIQPHSEKEDYRRENGLLLRSDIHTLFDLNLIGIDGAGVIHVSSRLKSYREYNNKKAFSSLDAETKSNLKTRFLKFKP